MRCFTCFYRVSFFVILFVLCQSSLWSQTTWNGSFDDDWTNPSNWSAGVPAPGNDVIIAGTMNLNIINVPGIALNTLSISAMAPVTFDGGGTITITSAFTVNSDFTIASSLSIVNNGIATVAASATLYSPPMLGSGNNFINDGTFIVNGTIWIQSNSINPVFGGLNDLIYNAGALLKYQYAIGGPALPNTGRELPSLPNVMNGDLLLDVPPPGPVQIGYKVQGDVQINGSATFTSGIWLMNGNSFNFAGPVSVAIGLAKFGGGNILTISGSGVLSGDFDFAFGNTLNELVMNRPGALLTLGISGLTINSTLTLSSGSIDCLTNSASIYVQNTNPNAIVGGSANSYILTNVMGYLRREIPNGTPGGDYRLPVGTASGYFGCDVMNPTFTNSGSAYLMAYAEDVTPATPITSSHVIYCRVSGMVAMLPVAGLRLYSSLAAVGGSVAGSANSLPLSAYTSLPTAGIISGQFIETSPIMFAAGTQWLGITGAPPPPVSPYTWVGASGANWQSPLSWSPPRNAPAVTDELIFPAGTHTPTNVPHQTISKLTVRNGANVTLAASNPTNWLTVTAMPDGAIIENGGRLDLGAPASNIALDVAAGSRCLVQGTLQTQYSAVIGAGDFFLDQYGLLATMRDDGINGASLSGGAIQTATASYNSNASYEFTSASPGAERDMNFRQQGGKNGIFSMLGLYVGASAGTRRLNSNISISGGGEVVLKGRTTLYSSLTSQIFFPFPFPRCTMTVKDGAELWNNGFIQCGDGADIIIENGFLTMVGPNGGGGTGTGVIAGSARLRYSGASMLSYTGGGTFTTDDEIFPLSMPVPVWVSSATVVALNNTKSLQAALTLSSGGKLDLNNYNLTLNGLNTSTGGAFRGATLSGLVLNGTINGDVAFETGFGTLGALTLNHAQTPLPQLSGQVNILNTLTLQNGILAVSQPNSLTLDNPISSALAGGSSASYIRGAFRRTMQAGITSDGTSYTFPVGDNAYRPLTLANVRTGGVQPVIQAQSFANGATMWSSPLTAGLPQNWLLQSISGNFLTGTFQAGTAQTQTPIGLRVASASAQSGSYSDIGADETSQPRSSLPQAATISANGTYFGLAGAVPSIISFTPRVARPGQTVTINGQFLSSVTGVSFGNVPAASFTVVSPTQITAIVGASGASGALSVQSSLGAATATLPFTWVGPPTITAVTPNLGAIGQTITIRGAEFHTTPIVTIGGLGASSVTAASLTELRVSFNQATTGILTIVASGGTVSWAQPFMVLAPPVITTFSTVQPIPGGLFTVFGANFVSGLTQVSLGGVPLSATVNSPTQMTVVAPQSANAPLVVTTPAGTVLSTISIVVIPSPTISNATPVSVQVGDPITIVGTNYINTQTVSIGGIPTTFTVNSPTSITAIAPSILSPTSQATVSVTTRSGTASFSRQVLLRQPPDPIMTLTGFTPAEVVEGQQVTVSGVNVPNAAVFRLQSQFATLSTSSVIQQLTSATVQNIPVEIRLNAPSGLIPQNLSATLATIIAEASFPNGVQTARAALPIKILAPDAPRLGGFSPNIGGALTTVLVSGVNFGISTRSSIQAVFIGGLPVQSFTVLSPTQIRLLVGRVTSGTLSIQTGSGFITTSASFTFNTLLDAEPVSATDSLALDAFYTATKGALWTTSTNWTNGFPVALRFGVKVERGRVVELTLPQNNLDSTLPWEALAQLTALRTLRLAGNTLRGTIPQNVCSMPALQILDLSGNRFDGSIDALCCLPAGLLGLNISNNRLSGVIPECLRRVSALQSFDASGNQFIGGFPSVLVQMPQMRVLNLRGNRLSGALPSSIGLRTSALAVQSSSQKQATLTVGDGLQRLDIGKNNFTGVLPTELGNLTAIRELLLDSNGFVGAIPASLGNMTSLQMMTIAGNNITSLPNLSRTSPRLAWLDVSGNRLPFAELERLISVPVFMYAPQRLSLPILGDTLAVIDAPFALRVPVEGLNNRFRWFKNGSSIEMLPTTTDALEFAAFAERDTGLYRCEITNTLLPLLVVSTATVRVQGVLPNTVPDSVVIIAPVQAEIDVPTLPLLQWSSISGAAQYRLEFSREANFVSTLTSVTVVQTTTAVQTGRVEVDSRFLMGFPLAVETRYFWRVRAENIRGAGRWTVGNFTTAAANALGAQRLDFDKVPRFDTAFSTLVLRNLSQSRIRLIDGITTSLTAFVCEDVRGREIPPGESLPVRVRFIPTILQAVSASLTMRFVAEGSSTIQTQSLSNRLLGRGGALKLIAPEIDTSLIGTTKLLAVQVVNVGDREAELLRVDLRRGAREYTYRADVDGGLPVGVGDTTAVLLKFIAERSGAASPETIVCQADIDTVSTPLLQFGRNRRSGDVLVGIGLRAIPPQAPPGAKVMLELYLTNIEGENREALLRSGTPYFTASVRFNRQVLIPDASAQALLRALRNTATKSTMQTYSIPTAFWNGRDDVLLRIPCRAVAGNSYSSPLVIEQIQWADGNVHLSNVVSGNFRTLVSQAGGKRLIGSSLGSIVAEPVLRVTRLAPNPIADDLEVAYTLMQDASVEISLINARGEVVLYNIPKEQRTGEHLFYANLRSLPSGSYMINIRAGKEQKTLRIEILR